MNDDEIKKLIAAVQDGGVHHTQQGWHPGQLVRPVVSVQKFRPSAGGPTAILEDGTKVFLRAATLLDFCRVVSV